MYEDYHPDSTRLRTRLKKYSTPISTRIGDGDDKVTAYIPDHSLYPIALTASTIAQAIDYDSLDEDSPLTTTTTPYIQQTEPQASEFRKKLGSAVHALADRDSDQADEYASEAVQALKDADPRKTPERHRYDKIKKSNDLIDIYDPQREIYRTARIIKETVDRAIDELGYPRTVMREEPIVSTVDGVPIACRPDRLMGDTETPLVTEIKTSLTLNTSTIIQTEAQRRAISERLEKPISAAIIRATLYDCQIVHIRPRSRLANAAWDAYRRRAIGPDGESGLYNDIEVQIWLDRHRKSRQTR